MKLDENLRKLLFKFMESKALLNFQVESLIQLRKITMDEVYMVKLCFTYIGGIFNSTRYEVF